MLEIPEAQVLAEQITHTLRGKTIRTALAASSPHGLAWYRGDPAAYGKLFKDHTVEGALALGGQVEIHAGQMRLLLHDGINCRYFKPGEQRPAKHQLLLEFEDGCALVCTVQMYGGMQAYSLGDNDNPYYLAACSKPNPLSTDFDEAYFERLLRSSGPKQSVKALLATEQRIPGLGNGCLQDILFTARLNPQSKLISLRDGDMLALFNSVKEILAAMTAGGGRDTEKDLCGRPGGYRTILSSKTQGVPCPTCGAAVLRKAYMGGNVYFCPRCQPVFT